ncbi:MAG TPA: hemolysin family protein [Stellaceae bacterium]|nr:hemolysin family protein [Stellaceae bacterium]
MTSARDPSDEDERPALTLWERLRRWSGLPAGDGDEADENERAPDPEEQALIRNVLRMRTLQASDVMVPRVDIMAVEVGTPFSELVELLVSEGHSRLPVYRGDLDHVIGMVHVKDVLGFVAARRTTTLENLLRKALFVAPSTPVIDLLSQMRQQRVHMAFVVDEFGGIDGLITIEDVVEEIVGEIEDEHDEDEPARIMERADGTLLVDARTPIEDLEEKLGVGLRPDEDEVDTVGGLIFMLAGYVPGRGETLSHGSGTGFEILDADERRVRMVRVTPPSEEDEDDDGA